MIQSNNIFVQHGTLYTSSRGQTKYDSNIKKTQKRHTQNKKTHDTSKYNP